MDKGNIKNILWVVLGVAVIITAVNKLTPKNTYSAAEAINKDAVVSVQSNTPSVAFKSPKLIMAQSVAGLPIGNASVDKSDNGLPRTRWSIRGVDKSAGGLEFIGDKDDGSVIAGQCHEFGKDGNDKPWSKGSPCFDLFEKIVGNITEQNVSEYLMNNANVLNSNKSTATARISSGALSIELGSDRFFFIRNNLKKQ